MPGEHVLTGRQRPGKSLARLEWLFRRLTLPVRGLPQFLLIGAPKCGTTSLFGYLVRHPAIRAPLKKEVLYFEKHYRLGEKWYRAHFPSSFRPNGSPSWITGEASPIYLQHPSVPERVKDLIPEARFIVLLRDPVDRAWSHYRHNLRTNREVLPFEEALEGEPERNREGARQLEVSPQSFPAACFQRAYLNTGHYATHLGRWFKCFPSDRFLILSSEELFASPDSIYGEVLDFLGVSKWSLAAYPAENAARNRKSMNEKTRERLVEYFRPHNHELFALLNREFPWDSK